MIVSFNVNSSESPIVALGYRDDDHNLRRPAAMIVRQADGLYHARGYFTGFPVHTGNLTDCCNAIRNYGSSISYGDPDTDWGLLAF